MEIIEENWLCAAVVPVDCARQGDNRQKDVTVKLCVILSVFFCDG